MSLFLRAIFDSSLIGVWSGFVLCGRGFLAPVDSGGGYSQKVRCSKAFEDSHLLRGDLRSGDLASR